MDQNAANLLAQAVAQHQSGRLPEAAALYQKVLAIAPNNSQALHNLGVVAHHQRNHERAITLIEKAIKLEGTNAGYYYNLGNACSALERFEEAAGHYRRAVALKSDYAAAYFNLGGVAFSLDHLDEAADAYRQAIRIAPGIAEGHSRLADVLVRQGFLEKAESEYRQALTLKPDFAEAMDRLGRLFFERGEGGTALAMGIRSFNSSGSENAKALFVDAARYCSRAGELQKPVDGLIPLLTRAISEHWLRPQDVMVLAGQALAFDSIVGPCIMRAFSAWPARLPEIELFGTAGLPIVAKNSLLVALLESAPGSGEKMERFVTAARATILERLAHKKPVQEDVLAFYASLANQALITEYVFFTTDAELAEATSARDQLVHALAEGDEVPPLLAVAVGAYFPLSAVTGAERLLQMKWPSALTKFLDRQVREPLREQEIARNIPALTPIDDQISRLVQDQYEENPYPRWVETLKAWGQPTEIDEYMREHFPEALFRPLGKRKIDILIAGGGTGRQAIEIARQFPDARVLSVDLSRAALAYGKRKSDEMRISNIEYGQADVIQIGKLGRRFDAIYASGVLHHLADPFSGWRALLGVLAPNGLMNVGLYSERAREDVVAAQRFVSEKGLKPTANDIRRAREELQRLPSDSPLRNVTLLSDFYSLSDLRDLLFHVQEHRMTLPQIARFLSEYRLTFLGFDQAPHILQRYRDRFPDDKAMVDLSQWERFEEENPRAFIGMYQFWVQKQPE